MDFLNVSADTVVEKDTDRLGGFRVHDAGVYPAVVKAAYLDKSAGGANCIVVLLDDGSNFKFTSTEYITSGTAKGCKNTYECKKTNKNKLLPGMHKMNALSELLTGKPLSKSVIEDKIHKIYSKDANGEVPQPRKTLVEWTGKVVKVGMLKILENKREKVDDKYVAVADTREFNEIDKWFNEDSKTLVEVQNQSEAKFHIEWAKVNEGKVRDKTKKDLAKPLTLGAAGPVTAAPLSFS